MTTYVIGDVQGCYQRAQALIERIRLVCAHPELIFVGDLVNRGPDSLATLRLVRALGAKTVLGNHDLHLLAVAQGIRKTHDGDTLNDIFQAPDCDELLHWLRHQPLAHFENGHLIVHAGVLPQWSAQKTLDLAHEVETVLRSANWIDFLHHMYGNTPMKWSDDLAGFERLRCIVNGLTRLRYCSADGTMQFAGGDDASKASSGRLPWFDVAGRKSENVTVVFGHWSARGLTLRPRLIGLDTGCVWGQLTAICLEDRSLIQVDCPQYRQPG